MQLLRCLMFAIVIVGGMINESRAAAQSSRRPTSPRQVMGAVLVCGNRKATHQERETLKQVQQCVKHAVLIKHRGKTRAVRTCLQAYRGKLPKCGHGAL